MVLFRNNDSSASFGDKLWRGIEGAFAKGSRAFLFWGLNQTSVSLLNKMLDSGMQQYVVGVVDDKVSSDLKVSKILCSVPARICQKSRDRHVGDNPG